MTNNIEQIRQVIKNKGYNWIEGEYITCKSKLVLEKDGYRYSLSYNQLLKGSPPKKWGKSNPFSVQNLRVYLKRENATCYVPDQIFDCTNVRFVCECGNEYEVALNNFFTNKAIFLFEVWET